jgi:hypothetical protein
MPHDPEHRRKYREIRQTVRPSALRYRTSGEPRLVEDAELGPALLFANSSFDPRRVQRVLAPPGTAVDGSDGWRYKPTSATARHLLLDLLELLEPTGGKRYDDLERFASERAREIVAFVKKHGQVGWCGQHDRPWPCHRPNPPRRVPRSQPGDLTARVLFPEWFEDEIPPGPSPKESLCPGPMNPEPLRYLWHLGLTAVAVVHIQAALEEDRPGNSEDWAILTGMDPVAFREARKAARVGHGGTWQAEQLLGVHVNRLLEQVGLKIHVYPEVIAGKTRLRGNSFWSRTSPLYTAVVAQLFLVAIGARGLAICSGCGTAYEPGRAPARGEFNYCDSAECERKKWARQQESKRRNDSAKSGKRKA